MHQAVTHIFIQKLRSNLNNELDWIDDADGANRATVLASFDRAALATVLDGGDAPAPASNKYVERGRKAAATRKRNKLKAAQDTTRTARSNAGAESEAGA